ncbi:ECF transporter S component [Clostridium sp. Cult3]|uniref:ECF transporter S component n=1 Tax=Clostridium sp. Cult3 TaxID=2079004 RepID=UPI001F357C32|nr:ECF transporter S component [Clostridium sp. Cult3]MCF6459500.1 ECF transporter S component [Clostridium sp. Cult3]
MRFRTKDLVTAAVLLALGIILPTIIHMSGINGAIFLPMHIPVLIAGLTVGPALGFTVGIISPIINHMLTGMPPVPIFWIMIVELGLYGLISGFLYRKIKMTLCPSLIISMIIGRLGGALMVLLLGKGFGLPMPPMDIYIKGITLTALPGIIIQLIFIPMIVRAYEKDRDTIW